MVLQSRRIEAASHACHNFRHPYCGQLHTPCVVSAQRLHRASNVLLGWDCQSSTAIVWSELPCITFHLHVTPEKIVPCSLGCLLQCMLGVLTHCIDDLLHPCAFARVHITITQRRALQHLQACCTIRRYNLHIAQNQKRRILVKR